MANESWYAWSEIRGGDADGNVAILHFGEAVTADKAMVDEAGFAQLIESGAIRQVKPPEVPDTWQDSPINYLLDQAKKAADGVMNDASVSPESMAAAQMSLAATVGDPDAQALAVEQPNADDVNKQPADDGAGNGGNGT